MATLAINEIVPYKNSLRLNPRRERVIDPLTFFSFHSLFIFTPRPFIFPPSYLMKKVEATCIWLKNFQSSGMRTNQIGSTRRRSEDAALNYGKFKSLSPMKIIGQVFIGLTVSIYMSEWFLYKVVCSLQIYRVNDLPERIDINVPRATRRCTLW